MLFNSYEFIALFLPTVAAIFFLAGLKSQTWALRWLIVASIFFYTWWRPFNLLIIIPSVLVNFIVARTLVRLNREENFALARAILAAGIVFDLAVLGYFKYANFFVDATNDVFGTSFVLERIILPLGISFFTFQEIAFLIDVHGRRIDSVKLEDYCLFVLFFPQLIAGPIVHYREMMPQFRSLTCIFDKSNVSVGLTLFFIGLFKKVFLADSIAPAVSAIYEHAGTGAALSFFPAWMAAVGFTLQIYFDFSGYTDMALGAARLFGIRLPPNFDSPLRASSIIEFWSRWHITLTRFLTAYIYNPLSLSIARRRLAKGLQLEKRMNARSFLELLALPTLITMFLSGFWHGAGYLFLIWGLLHGTFLVINHAWREFGPSPNSSIWKYAGVARPFSFLLTALCVVTSMVVFRSPTVAVATSVLEGMLGLNGVAIPETIYNRLGPLAIWLQHAGVSAGLGIDIAFIRLSAWLIFLSGIAFLCPNSLQLLRAYDPAVGWKAERYRASAPSWALWRPSLAWAVAISIVAIVGALHLGAESEFLYWQF